MWENNKKLGKNGYTWVSFATTTFHMSIGMSPFRELYVYYALAFSDMIFGDSRAPKAKYWVEESQEILIILKDNLQVAQNQQKKYADKHREERTFQVDYLVYLRLHSHKKHLSKAIE